MNRPSRRLRESATTTWKNGRFLAPPRASLITTMKKYLLSPEKDVDYMMKTSLVANPSPRRAPRLLAQARKAAAKGPQHLLHASSGDHFHHFLGLVELREEAIDFLHGYACSRRDAALARCLQQLGTRALHWGHRVDDALQTADGTIIGLRCLRRPRELASKFVEQTVHT